AVVGDEKPCHDPPVIFTVPEYRHIARASCTKTPSNNQCNVGWWSCSFWTVLTTFGTFRPSETALGAQDAPIGTGGLRPHALVRASPLRASPSNVHLVLDFLGHYFRSRDVVTIFVCRSLRWFLLGTTRMLLVTSEVDVCRKLLQHVRELLCIHAAEDAPVRTGDADHHPVIGLRYL